MNTPATIAPREMPVLTPRAARALLRLVVAAAEQPSKRKAAA